MPDIEVVLEKLASFVGKVSVVYGLRAYLGLEARLVLALGLEFRQEEGLLLRFQVLERALAAERGSGRGRWQWMPREREGWSKKKRR